MIKGINKQVLEILEPSSGYFEKALFFVKPEYAGFSENKLKELAQNELKSVIKPPLQKSTKNFKNIKFIISGLSIFIFGIFLGFILSFFV
jgi:hypothetical protein